MQHSNLLRLLALTCVLLLVAATAQAAGYVKFDGVNGEATDKSHKGWSNVTSFSQAMSSSAGAATGSSRARGGATFEDITIVRDLDKASPKLAEALAKGKVFPKVTLELAATYGGARATYYKVELKNATITSYQVGGSASGLPKEEVRIKFESVTVTYTQYDSSGKSAGKVQYSWNVAAGK